MRGCPISGGVWDLRLEIASAYRVSYAARNVLSRLHEICAILVCL
jgi:putative component of toxin-antitoxin plasmid stabilization module